MQTNNRKSGLNFKVTTAGNRVQNRYSKHSLAESATKSVATLDGHAI